VCLVLFLSVGFTFGFCLLIFLSDLNLIVVCVV